MQIATSPLLVRLNACAAAREWASDFPSLADAWAACPRGDWLLWLAGHLKIPRPLLVLAACACARTVLHLIPEGEERPRVAIETAEAWARGGDNAPSLDDVHEAGHAAYIVVCTTTNNIHAAAYAAHAAAYTATSAPAYAGDAEDAAHGVSQVESVTVIRAAIPWTTIETAAIAETAGV
jgi:hypothetical protein